MISINTRFILYDIDLNVEDKKKTNYNFPNIVFPPALFIRKFSKKKFGPIYKKKS